MYYTALETYSSETGSELRRIVKSVNLKEDWERWGDKKLGKGARKRKDDVKGWDERRCEKRKSMRTTGKKRPAWEQRHDKDKKEVSGGVYKEAQEEDKML